MAQETTAMLYSGGLDSGAILWDYLQMNREQEPKTVHLLAIDYGQAAREKELIYTERMADLIDQRGVHDIKVVTIDIPRLYENHREENPGYYPWRNPMLVMVALGYCQAHDIPKLIVGGYPSGEGIAT